MRKKIILFFCLLLPMLACQVIPTPPALTPTAPNRDASPTAAGSPAAVEQTPVQPALSQAAPLQSVTNLASIPEFNETVFSDTQMTVWKPSEYNPLLDQLPLDINSLANKQVLTGLTTGQRRLFLQNGFVTIQGDALTFNQLRQEISTKYGQPYYLTCDAAANSLQQVVDQTILVLEREVLARKLIQIVQASMDEIKQDLPNLPGSILEKDARQALAYLAVGYRLLDPGTQLDLDDDIREKVYAQVDQVLRAEGTHNLLVIPEAAIDFSVFKPPAFYSGDLSLEAYYRGSSWFSRVYFPLDGNQVDTVSRAPLIITLAMRKAILHDLPVIQAWGQVDEAMAFLYGRSQADDPRRYALLMDRVYGDNISILTLSDDTQWQVFRGLAQTIPVAAAYPSLGNAAGEVNGGQGWRLLGTRVTLEQVVLSNLVFNRVGTLEMPRSLPTGLDMMAALGSTPAIDSIKPSGGPNYQNYLRQMEKIQQGLRGRSESQWLSSLASSWHYTFLPKLAPRDQIYPPYMQTEPWKYKDLNSSLANWAAFSHRSNFLLDLPIVAAETPKEDKPVSPPAPGYVEPDADVFYRLSYLANVLVDGLNQRDLAGLVDGGAEENSLNDWLLALQDLGDRLMRLGDIAAKEQAGEILTTTDFALIQAPLGVLEQVDDGMDIRPAGDRVGFSRTLTVPVAANIAEGGGSHLVIATGRLDRIFVAVPLNGELVAAQGGQYSYYEFNQPVDKIMPDEEWRWIVANAQPARPEWTANWMQPGGSPVKVLAFRLGDLYRITSSGANLSVREIPSMGEKSLFRLHPGDTVEIVDGPQVSQGINWWKIKLIPDGENIVEGWVIENVEWFERAWGQ